MSVGGGRFLPWMSTRLYQQCLHRRSSNIYHSSSSSYFPLYHYGTNNNTNTSSSRRLHFHHHRKSAFNTSRSCCRCPTSSSAVPLFTQGNPLALDINLVCGHRFFNCQHSLGDPSPKPFLPFLLRFPPYHQHISFWQQQSKPPSHRDSSTFYSFTDKYIRKTTYNTSLNPAPLFTPLRNMSTVHLAKGSVCPPLQDGKVRLYNMKYCPFAQRALLVAEAKGISYDIVNCHLTAKPEWLLEKNPEGKVPVLETNDGKILYESLVVSDYLDEVYPSQRPLHPQDAYKRALDKILVEKFSSVTSLFYKILFAIRDSEPDPVKQEKIANFVKGLKPFEDDLASRGTLYFAGDEQPGMLDYMIWPWFERIPAIKSKLPDLFDYDTAKTENPKLEKWRQAMKKDPAVSKFLLSSEIHLQFMESFLSGSPDYDF